jgi:hypothetical protein
MGLTTFDKTSIATQFALLMATVVMQEAGPKSWDYQPPSELVALRLRAANIAGAMGAGLVAVSAFVSGASFGPQMAVTQRLCNRLGFYAGLVCVATALLAAEVGWAATGVTGELRIAVPHLVVQAMLPTMGLMMFSCMTEQAVGTPTATWRQVYSLTAARVATTLLGTLPRVWPTVPGIWALYFSEIVYLYFSRSSWLNTINAFRKSVDTSATRGAIFALLGTAVVLLETIIAALYVTGYVKVVVAESVTVGLLLYRLMAVYLQVQLSTRIGSERAFVLAELAHAQERLRLQRDREDEREKYYRYVFHELRVRE